MITTCSFFDRDRRQKGKLFSIAVSSPSWSGGEVLDFLAPTRDMVSSYKRGYLSAKDYRVGYVQLLKARKVQVSRWLQSLKKNEDIVLMCWCREGDFCHRQIVADLIRKNRPDIKIEVH